MNEWDWIDTLGDATGGKGGDWIDILGDATGSLGGGIDWGALATGAGNYGLNDRGLGISGGGTLSPQDISGLGGGGIGGYGLNDRGLGVSGGGTLSPQEIAGLGPPGVSLGDLFKGIGRSTGLTNQGGDLDWGNLLSILAPIGAGLYATNRTGKATDQLMAGIDRAQAGLTATGAENKNLYAPYRAAGDVGLQRLLQQPRADLAGQFRPLGSGRGLSLSNIMRGA